jgi:superoxide dismutase, Cu-Zn family
LPPGWHGMHFHEKGDCSDPGFKNAGAHVHTKTPVVHGLLNSDENDSGDLPNLYVAPDGTATVELYSTFVSLKGEGGRPALLDADGSALVVHASPDDYKSQPIGGAGARIACAVIQ